VRNGHRAERRTYEYGEHRFSRLPAWYQQTLSFLYQFCNAPVIEAVLGAIIGLVPPLHRAFFADTEQGGYFKAWLTSSVKNG
jgi:auxin efflux carrier family protein